MMYVGRQGNRIAAEHGVVKAKGSWVTLDTPAQKSEYFLPPTSLPSTPPKSLCWCWSACWENLHAFKNIFLLCEQTFSAAFHSTLLFQCRTTCLYIHCPQYTSKWLASFESIFSVDPKNVLTINVFQQAHRGFLSPCYLFNQEAKI